MIDWLWIATQPQYAQLGRILRATPHEIAIEVAHNRISYGQVIEEETAFSRGQLATMMKRAVFLAVRDAITDHSAFTATNSPEAE